MEKKSVGRSQKLHEKYGHLPLGPGRTVYLCLNGQIILRISREYTPEAVMPLCDHIVLAEIDVDRTERDYWRGVRRFLFWLQSALPKGYGDWPEYAYRFLRYAHHYYARRKSWRDALPPSVVQWAGMRIADMAGKLEHVDNTRVAQVRNSPQMRRFKRQSERGCCGQSEWIETGPDGKAYLLGFNYGH